MTARRPAVARVEPVEARARHLLGRNAGVVELEVLALLEPAHALAVDLEIGRPPRGETPVRADVVELLRARVERRGKHGRK